MCGTAEILHAQCRPMRTVPGWTTTGLFFIYNFKSFPLQNRVKTKMFLTLNHGYMFLVLSRFFDPLKTPFPRLSLWDIFQMNFRLTSLYLYLADFLCMGGPNFLQSQIWQSPMDLSIRQCLLQSTPHHSHHQRLSSFCSPLSPATPPHPPLHQLLAGEPSQRHHHYHQLAPSRPPRHQ